jgi:hypothetical protein
LLKKIYRPYWFLLTESLYGHCISSHPVYIFLFTIKSKEPEVKRMASKEKNNPFQEIIEEIIGSLKKRELENAEKLITVLVSMDIDTPEPHNLFGILSEIKGKDDSARKHYRAAYALDPTYKPACRNLERLVLGSQNHGFDYGGIEAREIR